MFNYPGSMPDNVKEGVDELRRWITKFIPELEQQLSNLGADNFSSAYNERLEGLTALSGAWTSGRRTGFSRSRECLPGISS